ncbi:MAG: HpcH/HpaI aldolase family protein [Chthoniobacterales bacterium]
MYPSPGTIERIGRDWDWIWLDGQHGQIADYQQMLAMVRACNYVDRAAYVRVPSHEPATLALALDMGANAVIVPQVDTVEQAHQLVQAAKFPPVGNRSFGGRRPIDLWGRDYVKTANKETKLICQIESPRALANAATIAALSGVDGLFIGPDDLLLRLNGSIGGPDDKKILQDAIRRVAATCQKEAKDCLCVGIGAEMTKLCADAGVNYIVAGGDVSFLASGSNNALEISRQTLKAQSNKKTFPSKRSSLY